MKIYDNVTKFTILLVEFRRGASETWGTCVIALAIFRGAICFLVITIISLTLINSEALPLLTYRCQ
jgi:hypothetical protein